MPPPKLARNAPVLNVLHPVTVGVLELLGDQLDFVGHDRVEGGLGQLRHAHPPLQRQAGLHYGAGALAGAHRRGVFFGLGQVSRSLEILGNLGAGGKALHARVLQAVGTQGSVFVEYVEYFESVLLADGVVVPVVGRSDFEAAGSEIRGHVVVEDDGHFASANRNAHVHAVQRRVAHVLGVDGYGYVAHDGFRARGRDGQVGAWILNHLVLHIVEGGVDVLVNDFFVRKRGFRLRVPVDHAQSAVNVALGVQVGKNLVHAVAADLVHGEGRAVPVAAGAELFELLEYDSAVLVRPFPGVLQKGVAAEVGFFNPFSAELLHHLGLGRDRRVVGARNPAGIESAHAGAAHEHILNGVVEHVAHVQYAGHVGRRNHNGVGRTVVGSRGKSLVLEPCLVPALFNLARSVL